MSLRISVDSIELETGSRAEAPWQASFPTQSDSNSPNGDNDTDFGVC
jgi:hypothetical protein